MLFVKYELHQRDAAFAALSDPTRRGILERLGVAGSDCNLRATRIAVSKPQSDGRAMLVPLVGRWLSWESTSLARNTWATSRPSRRKRRTDHRICGLQPLLQPERHHRRGFWASVASVSWVAARSCAWPRRRWRAARTTVSRHGVPPRRVRARGSQASPPDLPERSCSLSPRTRRRS